MTTRHFIWTLLLASTSVLAQPGSEARVYVDQFTNLSNSGKQMLVEVVDSQPQWAKSPSERLALSKRLWALITLIHRLEETASEANIESFKQSRIRDKKLMLVTQGCDGLAFMLRALDFYVETEDRAFLGFARDGAELVARIKNVF